MERFFEDRVLRAAGFYLVVWLIIFVIEERELLAKGLGDRGLTELTAEFGCGPCPDISLGLLWVGVANPADYRPLFLRNRVPFGFYALFYRERR